jgi:hypothetical protein
MGSLLSFGDEEKPGEAACGPSELALSYFTACDISS